MNRYFSIERNDDCVSLYNVKGMVGLSVGEVFFKKCGDSIQTHPDYKPYEFLLIDSIDNLSESEQYFFKSGAISPTEY
jgi:hypothetical protein